MSKTFEIPYFVSFQVDYGTGNPMMILGRNMPDGSPNVVTLDSSRVMSSLPNASVKFQLKFHQKAAILAPPPDYQKKI